MGLKKGMKPNNPTGHPVGATGKVSGEIKEWMRKVLEDNQEQFVEDLKSVSEKERLDILTRLALHLTPKAVDPIVQEKEQLFKDTFMERFFPK